MPRVKSRPKQIPALDETTVPRPPSSLPSELTSYIEPALDGPAALDLARHGDRINHRAGELAASGRPPSPRERSPYPPIDAFRKKEPG